MALTNEDLLAISQLLDVKLDAKLKSELQPLKDDIRDIKLHLENVTDWNIKLLAENHSNLVDKFNESVKTADKTALYEIHVRMLTDKVDKLSKEVSSLKLRMA